MRGREEERYSKKKGEGERGGKVGRDRERKKRDAEAVKETER